MPNTEHPTQAGLLALLQEYRQVYDAMRQEMRIDQDFLNWSSIWNSNLAQLYLTGFPRNYPIKAYPIAQIGVQNAVNNVMTGETAQVTAALPTGLHRDPMVAQQHTERIEAAAQAMLWTIDTQSTESPLRDMLAQGYGLGFGCLSYQIMWERIPKQPDHGKTTRKEKEAWAEYERKRQNYFPFDVRSLHPLNVLPCPDDDPPSDYFVEEEISVRAAAREYPHLAEKLGQNGKLREAAGSSAMVKRVVYCSKDWYAIYVDGEAALTAEDGADDQGVMPNTTGVLWYALAWSGFGMQDDKRRMEYRGRGMVRDARNVIASFVSNRNIIDAVRGIAGFPQMEAIGPTKEQAEEETADFAFGPAKMFAHSADIKIQPLNLPQIPQYVFQGLEQDRAMLEMLMGPEVLRGIPLNGETASGQRTRKAAANSPFRALKKNAEQAVAKMLQDMFYLIKNELAEPLTLWMKGQGVVLDPKDIENGSQFFVEFSPPSDEEKAQQLQEGIQRKKEGGISQRRFMSEYNDIDDPDQEMAQIASEQVLQQPPMQQWMAQQVQQRADERIQQLKGPQAAAPAQPAAPSTAPAQPQQPGQAQQPPPPGPGGFPLPGEQPAPPVLGGPQDAGAFPQPGGPQPGMPVGVGAG